MITTRFAPSPTGYLHIWSLRTVLYNYLVAKKNNGKFMLRIEDTDRTRFVEWSVENMINILEKVWLTPDEWPNNPWDLWPYFQSERLDIYKKYIQELLKKDKAYYCFCSPERLTKLREEQQSLWLPTKYDGHCRYLTPEEVEEKLKSWASYTIRLKVPKNEDIVFEDMIKWKIKVNSKDIDDQVLLKTDGFPTYHMASVVDDHLMKVTHVIRWDEWTPSTPKHIILYNAFEWEKPIFAHIPLLLWTDKKKLSKRTWDVSVEKYLEKGYLVEALLNYIALLGWNPKTTEEFFSMQELIERFDLNQVHKSWAVFDVERLNFFNAHYLKKSDTNALYEKFLKYLWEYDKEFLEKIKKFSDEYNKKILNEIKTKIKKFDEYKENTDFLYDDKNEIKIDLLVNQKMKIPDLETAKKGLEITLDILKNRNNKNFDSIDEAKNIFIEEIKKAWMKNGQVLWPTRVALSSKEFSIWALELIFILWIEKSIEKIKKYLEKIQ